MNGSAPIVVKFGGSSFAEGAEAYLRVARHLVERHRDTGRKILAVVSAAPGATEAVRDRLNQINARAGATYTATAFSLPDTESAIMLATAVEACGLPAEALNSHQNGIQTDTTPMWSRVQSVDRTPLDRAFTTSDVVCVSSGHATDGRGRFTWMGKNSGDLSALVLAGALQADHVDIYSDVEGVYSSDPNQIPSSALLPRLGRTTARLMAARGAKVLDRRALDVAEQHGITVRCRLNHGDHRIGTVVVDGAEETPPIVIVDCRSVVMHAPTPTDADHLHGRLLAAGIPCLRVTTGDGDTTVVVTGGYSDLTPYTEAAVIAEEKLVSIVHPEKAVDIIAPTVEAALSLGRRLHDESRTDADIPAA